MEDPEIEKDKLIVDMLFVILIAAGCYVYDVLVLCYVV